MDDWTTISDETIREILRSVRTIAMVGASHKPDRPSFGVLRFLLARGYTVFPVNPGLAGQSIQGQTVHADLASVPEPIDMVDVFRASDALPGIVEAALALSPRPKVLWTQLGVIHEDADAAARAAGLAIVMNRCPAIEYPRLIG